MVGDDRWWHNILIRVLIPHIWQWQMMYEIQNITKGRGHTWFTCQLDACKLEDSKVFHIHLELLDKNTKCFIEKSPNPSAWEIANLEKWSTTRQLNICFNNVDTFIETMQYCYGFMIALRLIYTNKNEIQKIQGGNEKWKQESRTKMMGSMYIG